MSKKSLLILSYAAILLAVLMLAAIGHRFYLVQQEKRDFAAAEQQIDSLAQQIEQLVGIPNETKKEKGCTYASRVYGKGPLGCSVSSTSTYRDTNLVEINKKLAAVSSMIGGKVYGHRGQETTAAFSEDMTRPQAFAQDLSGPKNLSCSVEYSASISTLSFSTSCGGTTISKVYPLRE